MRVVSLAMSGASLILLFLCIVLSAVVGLLCGWLWGSRRAQFQLAAAEHNLLASERALAGVSARADEMARAFHEQRALVAATEQNVRDQFAALAAEALARNNEGFLTLATEKLASQGRDSDRDLQARQSAIEALVKPVRESLDKVDHKIAEIERERGQAYGRLTEQVRALAGAHDRLESETGNLARALRAPAVRGRWGEVQLKRVVEMAGMLEHCDFEQQKTVEGEAGRLRPDLIVRLPGGRSVVVDAKAPLEAYLDAAEAITDDERKVRLRAHAAQVRAHVQKLSAKAYWSELQPTPEFVVLFLPGESFYSAALEVNPGLIEEGVAAKVLIATPTTLIALLRSVHYGWREERIAENAQQISTHGRSLHERVLKLTEHLAKVGTAIGRAAEAFNEAAGCMENRVLPAARKLEELGAGSGKLTPDLARVDVRPRLVAVRDPANGGDAHHGGEPPALALAGARREA